MRFNQWMFGPLFDEAGEGGGGGGAGGAGGAGEAPKTVGAMSVEELGGVINQLMSATLDTRLNAFDAKIDARFKKITPATPPGQKAGEGGAGGAAGGEKKDPFESETVKALQEQITQLQAKDTEREKKAQETELHGTIKGALSDFTWNEGGRDIAHDYYAAKATRDENGSVVIGGMPIEQYIKKHVPTAFKGSLAPRPVGGAGANKGGTGGTGTPQAFQLEDIKPGMTAEESAKARAAILAARQGR